MQRGGAPPAWHVPCSTVSSLLHCQQCACALLTCVLYNSFKCSSHSHAASSMFDGSLASSSSLTQPNVQCLMDKQGWSCKLTCHLFAPGGGVVPLQRRQQGGGHSH